MLCAHDADARPTLAINLVPDHSKFCGYGPGVIMDIPIPELRLWKHSQVIYCPYTSICMWQSLACLCLSVRAGCDFGYIIDLSR